MDITAIDQRAPFVFITTHRIKPGHLADVEELIQRYTDFLEGHDLGLRAHGAYFDDDREHVSLVQVQTDSLSAEQHMQLIEPWVAPASAHTDTVSVTIFGDPGPIVRTTLEAVAGSGATVTVYRPDVASFTRS